MLKKKKNFTKKISSALISERNGIRDWQNAPKRFREHENSYMHNEAVSKQFENKSTKNIDNFMKHGNLKLREKQQNWQNLLRIFSVIRKLVR